MYQLIIRLIQYEFSHQTYYTWVEPNAHTTRPIWVKTTPHKGTCVNLTQLNQPIPRCLCTFLKIIIWRNGRQTKKKSRSCHHIALITIFPMSQEFFNSDFGWGRYANFSEDANKFFCHKISHFSPRVAKFLRELMMNEWNVWYSIYIDCGKFLLPLTDMQFKISNN